MTRSKCYIDAAISYFLESDTSSSSLNSRNALSCVSLSDRNGLQVQNGDGDPSKHTP